MGQPKLLLPWRGMLLIRHVAEIALGSKLDELIVVIGYQAEQMKAALDGVAVRIVQNPNFMMGQSTSLRAGIEAASNSEAVLVLLADQPLLKSMTLDRLIDVYVRERPLIVAPRHAGQRGNPVLFDRSLFDELRAISGDRGARSVIERHAADVRWVDVGDEGVVVDIDTPAMYEELIVRGS